MAGGLGNDKGTMLLINKMLTSKKWKATVFFRDPNIVNATNKVTTYAGFHASKENKRVAPYLWDCSTLWHSPRHYL